MDKVWNANNLLAASQKVVANKQSLAMIVAVLNPKLRGWYACFCHSHWTAGCE